MSPLRSVSVTPPTIGGILRRPGHRWLETAIMDDSIMSKTDRRGRVRMPREERDHAVAERGFGGLSARRISEMVGTKHQTFAAWVERKCKAGGAAASRSAPGPPGWIARTPQGLLNPGLLTKVACTARTRRGQECPLSLGRPWRRQGNVACQGGRTSPSGQGRLSPGPCIRRRGQECPLSLGRPPGF